MLNEVTDSLNNSSIPLDDIFQTNLKPPLILLRRGLSHDIDGNVLDILFQDELWDNILGLLALNSKEKTIFSPFLVGFC